MLRPLMFATTLFAAALLAVAPAAFAGERIIEIWNPPEARQGAHLIGKTARPPHHRKVLAHRSAPAPRAHQTAQQPSPAAAHSAMNQAANEAADRPTNRATDRAADQTAAQPAADAASHASAAVVDAGRLKHNEVPPPKHDISRFDDIPRIVTPEGNVLRVSTDSVTAQVTH
ncbi:hypothetical protein [Paraburkholderia solisilvae]|uniref:Uncharacterized protein n=1 Tax=Paraburkholderia solisilvae TaxID=624376 RepID=A0A6J5E2Q5_9BURK|nr:hypothetical protein [Paraburkholderia solisilvae]CAB3759576.1 hypothetical protein LMG29739_03189 [Paraburkholderia solisilvae]